MKLNVFACQGGFLLSAECMLAPREANEAYWPVSAILGVVECDELPGDLCGYITKDIKSKHFSFVSTAEAFRAGLPTLATKNPFGSANLMR
jgi:hypothetical protein